MTPNEIHNERLKLASSVIASLAINIATASTIGLLIYLVQAAWGPEGIYDNILLISAAGLLISLVFVFIATKNLGRLR